MKIPPHILAQLDQFTAPPHDGDYDAHTMKAMEAVYEKANDCIEFTKWFASTPHASHCSKDADPSWHCTCGVDNALRAVEKLGGGE